MTTLFDVLNVNPAESVQPVQPAGVGGIAQTLAKVAGRGAQQAAGRDTRPTGQRVAEATQGVDPNDPASLIAAAQRLDAIGESQRAIGLRQIAANMSKQQELQGRDRFVTAGANVFDMQTGEWRTPPGQEDVDNLTQNQRANLYRHFTSDSIQSFLENPDSPLELITEESEDAEMTPEERRNRTLSQLQSVDSVLQSITDAEDTPIWGFGYDITKFVPQTNARELKNYVTTIQSNLAFDRLQKMRDESKTGGALGQVSNIELDLLKSSVASLDPASNSFDSQLQKVKDQYRNFRNALLGIDPAGDSYQRLGDGNLYYYNDAEEGWVNLTALSELEGI